MEAMKETKGKPRLELVPGYLSHIMHVSPRGSRASFAECIWAWLEETARGREELIGLARWMAEEIEHTYKIPWSHALGHVMAFGATKYDTHNWRKGLPYSKAAGSALRHLTAFEEIDGESNLPHLYHAFAWVIFLIDYIKSGVGIDDRYRPPQDVPHEDHTSTP